MHMPKAKAPALFIDDAALLRQWRLLGNLISDPGIDDEEKAQLRGLRYMVKRLLNNLDGDGIRVRRQSKAINS